MRLLNDCPLLLQLIILTLGTARLTVLITSDRITRAMRYRFERRYGRESYVGTLVRCPWCAGWWLGLVVAWCWLRWPIGTTEAMVPWALAMVGASLASYLAPNDDPPLIVGSSDEPFRTTDHFGNEYVIQHGNVITDGPTKVVLWPVTISDSSPDPL